MAKASMGKVVHITVDDRVEEAARLLVGSRASPRST